MFKNDVLCYIRINKISDINLREDKMSYLITGGIGYIGSCLVKKLVDEGRKVIAFDKALWLAGDKISDMLDAVKLVQGDVTNLTALLDTIKRYDVKYIVHLAAIHIWEPGVPIFDRSSTTSPFEWINVNITGTLNVFEAARILDVKKVIYASTYGVRPTGPTEDAPTKPESLYGKCKALDEFLGQMYYDEYGLDNIGLRFGMVYGPGKRAGGMWVVDIVRKPARGEPCILEQDPEMVVQWQNVEDCSKVITLALDTEKTEHKLFNTCAQPSTLREAANIVKKLLPNAEIKFAPKIGAPKYLFGPVEYDISRARKELGYEQIPLEKGFKDFVNETRKEAGLPEVSA
jgi:UDP-glucose 4-epimerase